MYNILMIPVMIVPTLCHYDLLQNMLNTIDYPIDHIIIVDNGGKLDKAECSFANKISIINMPSNLGVPSSWNLGIKLTPYKKWWLIASDDIEFKPNKLEKICKSKFNSIIVNLSHGRILSSFALHENVVDSIGLFNEYYYPGIGEENDYLTRMTRAGYKTYDFDFFTDVGGGGNTGMLLDLFNIENDLGKETLESLRVDIENKKTDWDLDHRRKMENLLVENSEFYRNNYSQL